jgi:hypothetical protein
MMSDICVQILVRSMSGRHRSLVRAVRARLSAAQVRTVPAPLPTAAAPVGEKARCQYEQAGPRIQVAGLAGVQRRLMRGQDLRATGMVGGEPRRMWTVQRSRRSVHPSERNRHPTPGPGRARRGLGRRRTTARDLLLRRPHNQQLPGTCCLTAPTTSNWFENGERLSGAPTWTTESWRVCYRRRGKGVQDLAGRHPDRLRPPHIAGGGE